MTKSKYICRYKNEFPDKNWLVKEDRWDSKQQTVRETQFTLGNGAICMRGVLEEIPYDSYPGTYIGGLFDRTGAQITELVNLPNPLQFRMDVYGEKLDPVAMDILHHKRTLDIKHGTLFRHTVYKTTHKKRLDYCSRRFISMHDKNLVVMEVALTPLDADMTISMQTTIDSGVTNKGTVTEGRKRHFQSCDISSGSDYVYRCVETFEKKTLVAYASALEVYLEESCKLVSDRAVNLRVKKNQTIKFRKYITIKSSKTLSIPKMRRETMKHLKTARKRGFEKLTSDHNKAWEKKWNISDIEMNGDHDAMRALRFNMYHLMICGNEDDDDVSIGAKTLSGEGYRGHVFWDTELFILPYFIYSNPSVARNILMYRYHRLNAARNNASSKGFEGALFPWESADTGEECTPSWAKDFDGKIIKIVTMDEEHHIVSDIAYAFAHYCKATGDDHFLWRYAIEVIIETARFWATRAVYNSKSKKYEIHKVMGPDEFHENVNNNAYTNILAQWNLKTACEWVRRFRRTSPTRFSALSKRLNIKKGETAAWKKIADGMLIPVSKKKNLIEQFKGFLKLKDHRITALNQHFMPEIPTSVDWSEVGKTQFIKQADVVMLLYLMSDKFTYAEKKKNYYYYERRTLHKSSLSPAIHSIVGLEVGDEDKALHYFSHALSTDLSDIHGNTADGIHAASAGGTWQAAVMGFAGMRPLEKAISFNPHIPSHWKGIKFKIWWRGALLDVSINHSKTEIHIRHRPKKGKILAEVYGETKQLKPNICNCFLHPSLKKKGSRRRSK
jgi:kojibiose phosphorylase